MDPFILAVASFLVGFVLYLLVSRYQKPLNENLLEQITDNFLTRSFGVEEVVNLTSGDRAAITESLESFVSRGLMKKRNGRYQLIVPLFFLDDRQFQRAMRLTANDEIMYGAAQHPFLTNLHLLVFYAIIPVVTILFVLAETNIYIGFKSLLTTYLGFLDLRVLTVYVIIMSILLTDAIENLIKAWSKERFSVIVGAQSGVYFDEGYASELSGRIPRGRIGEIRIKISLRQKLLNFFSEIPHGDIVLVVQGQKDPIRFHNMPFPRELFFVIRRVQLKGLGWRKRNARTLMMWRTKSLIPSVGG